MNSYKEFFLESRRLQGSKKIALVKSGVFTKFIQALASDESIELEHRAFVICTISAGLRVNEALSITKESFYRDNGGLYFQVKVLKKRKEDTRWCRVHPDGQAVVEQILKEKIGKLFDWTPITALRRAKKFFPIEGICNHSFRHSAVSYYLFEENMTTERAAKLIHINPKIVEFYGHLDERATLAKMFQGSIN